MTMEGWSAKVIPLNGFRDSRYLRNKNPQTVCMMQSGGRIRLRGRWRSAAKAGIRLGVKLSAFNLRLDGHTLENIFQSAKVFKHGGPYTDLLEVSPKEAKRDQRLQSSGALQAFRYQGEDFPLVPKSVFYDYLYIRAVKESLTAEEMKTVLQYDYFTDIEFNPARSINTQARTAALLKMMLEEYGEIPDFSRDEFIQYHEEHVYFE